MYEWELDHKESWTPENWCFWTVILEKTLESPLDCKEIQPVNPKGNQYWIFIGRTDAEGEASIPWPRFEELSHLKRPWFWEILKAGAEGDNRGWDGWMASPTQWTCIWTISGRWWRTGKAGLLQCMGLQSFRHDWATEPQIKFYWFIWFTAAAAKSLQSCPTLCDPIDSSPPGSSVPGILQARILEWVAISFSNACMHDLVYCQLFTLECKLYRQGFVCVSFTDAAPLLAQGCCSPVFVSPWLFFLT